MTRSTEAESAAVRVLFCYMGNICRSPTAHGLFRKLVQDEGLTDRIYIDSAGTHAYHVGHPPDERSQQTALRRGLDISDLRARKVEREDLEWFDYIVAMDQDNYMILSEMCRDRSQDKLYLMMDFLPTARMREVPDPYYGGASGFERVFDMVEEAAAAMLRELRYRHSI